MSANHQQQQQQYDIIRRASAHLFGLAISSGLWVMLRLLILNKGQFKQTSNAASTAVAFSPTGLRIAH
jgi:hypothetical protein